MVIWSLLFRIISLLTIIKIKIMDYVVLSAILAVIFGAISFSKKHWRLVLGSTAVVFLILLGLNIAILPVINLVSFPDIWIEAFIVFFVAAVFYIFSAEDLSYWKFTPALICLVVLLVLGFSGIHMGRSDKFCNMLKVDTVTINDFNKDLFPTKVKKMICVDETMAYKAAQDLLDTDPGLGSRVVIGKMTMQPIDGSFTIDNNVELAFEDGVIWVAPLEHKSFRKWWINDTTPGYVIVDATDATLKNRHIVTEVNGKKLALRFMENAFLWEDIEFHIKMNGYVGKGLNDHRFEIDNSGLPFWVLSAYEPTIGLTAKDSKGAITVDAQSGELKEYSIDKAPDWVDRIQPEEFILDQIKWWGEYQRGYVNSWWDQMDVQMPTPGLTLVYSEGKSFWYTGIQSLGSSNSNSESTSGFMLVNTRDKSAKYYKIAGVNEIEAQNIANDIPFAKTADYFANRPVLYNLRNIPSYFMVFKGRSGNATGYAFVSVTNRSIFGGGPTPEIAEQEYLKRMASSGMLAHEDDTVEKLEGDYTVKEITLVGTVFYLHIKELPGLEFYADNSAFDDLKWTLQRQNLRREPTEQKVHIKFGKGENIHIPLDDFQNLDLVP